ncbi:hypothetical protein SARC_09413 [Sphaeroforma arctica JP610]|uniref:Endonuclease/exonuclease/phosphatase domain-containing protein n=1 Tax=Sphaeroforma arctica JP610 TaxID=667725 RepID=A0A0L0FQ77_9EUKA|nr:hypothetical protein SARC_09413 [Sphaeroforma arctica JP610]KNC78143.1 hypothetical protein SARC_09413 [Sphaeroforma arctica JP610]|eukprot:XP_014152045.1 hypothetical protein SARC_09413 [Sphaeroforma arctica JP610]
MPCVYWCPPVMSIHAALAVKRTKDLAEGVPHILCGDFNFQPTSSMYKFVTTGTLGSDKEATPVANPWGKYFPKVEVPMRSSYAAVNGCEPNFTNYAKVKQEPTFIETLDYIFYSKGIEAESVVKLPHRDAVEGPLPNGEEPSDHILIGAKLNIAA